MSDKQVVCFGDGWQLKPTWLAWMKQRSHWPSGGWGGCIYDCFLPWHGYMCQEEVVFENGR